ncbi:hypothetical protein GCM10009799_14260 [Nocardiopsis rhodophaea]|uniref:MFS transporter n=1 Tax=Nocardiopsis rhodophaea TaxID=280238 RepID=A0ABN2SNR1_9ACTN
MSVGGLAAAIPLAIGTPSAFRWLFLAMAVLFVVSAGLIALLPDTRVAWRPATWRLSALRDRRLLALTTYDSIAALWLPMLNVAFPLWLTGRTGAPDALVGVLYAVNTATCVLLQIPMSRFVNGSRDALRAYTVNATLLMVSCVGFALAPLLGGWPTLILLSAAILVLTIGELCQVSAAWTLSYAIAPEQRRTEYLATFSLGRTSSARLYGPVLMTGGVLALGSTGWLLLALLFAAAALAPAVVRHRLPRPATP